MFDVTESERLWLITLETGPLKVAAAVSVPSPIRRALLAKGLARWDHDGFAIELTDRGRCEVSQGDFNRKRTALLR